MRLSVILPVYNVEPYLRRGLDAVLGQTYADLEAVCVDDGSTDGSSAVLDEYAARDPRVRVIRQENRGTLIARREAIAAATGDWCLFMDPDDTLQPTACARLAEVAARTRAEVVSVGFDIRGGECVRADQLRAVERYFNGDPGVFPVDAAYDRIFVARQLSWNLIGKMVRADVCKTAFAEQPPVYSIDAEDMYALFHILAHATAIEVIPDHLYVYSYGVGISTKTCVTLGEWRKSLRKLDTLAELRTFLAGGGLPACATSAVTHAAGRMIGSLFIKIAERMPSEADRTIAWRELKDAVPEEELVRALSLCYARKPQMLARGLARLGVTIGPEGGEHA